MNGAELMVSAALSGVAVGLVWRVLGQVFRAFKPGE